MSYTACTCLQTPPAMHHRSPATDAKQFAAGFSHCGKSDTNLRKITLPPSCRAEKLVGANSQGQGRGSLQGPEVPTSVEKHQL